MVVIRVTENQRSDILTALRIWMKEYGDGLKKTGSLQAISDVMDIVDCAGTEED